MNRQKILSCLILCLLVSPSSYAQRDVGADAIAAFFEAAGYEVKSVEIDTKRVADQDPDTAGPNLLSRTSPEIIPEVDVVIVRLKNGQRLQYLVRDGKLALHTSETAGPKVKYDALKTKFAYQEPWGPTYAHPNGSSAEPDSTHGQYAETMTRLYYRTLEEGGVTGPGGNAYYVLGQRKKTAESIDIVEIRRPEDPMDVHPRERYVSVTLGYFRTDDENGVRREMHAQTYRVLDFKENWDGNVMHAQVIRNGKNKEPTLRLIFGQSNSTKELIYSLGATAKLISEKEITDDLNFEKPKAKRTLAKSCAFLSK
jgi:hypothetical protein